MYNLLLLSLYVSFTMALIPTRDDAILFCLNPEIEPLNIIADEKVRVNHLKIKFHRIYNFFLNKWYFDDLYKNFFVNKTINFSNNLWKKIDIGLIDKLGPNNLALTTKNFSKFLSYLQSGYLYHYVFSFVIGMVILISFIIFFI